MGFKQSEVDKLLVNCNRRCCICHRFCGVKMETDHMKPESEGGIDDIDNAIPLCFECHAEVHAYNDKHPRGRKYHEGELKMHKEQWLKICNEHPEVLVDTPRIADPGPLFSLLTELEYNEKISKKSEELEGMKYETKQFNRAIAEGILSFVDEKLKESVMDAYGLMNRVNTYLPGLSTAFKSGDRQQARFNVNQAHNLSATSISDALEKLRAFLDMK